MMQFLVGNGVIGILAQHLEHRLFKIATWKLNDNKDSTNKCLCVKRAFWQIALNPSYIKEYRAFNWDRKSSVP